MRVRAWQGLGAAVLVAALPAPNATAAAPEPVLSSERVLSRLVDPTAMLTPLPPSIRMLMPSSYDRLGGNLDGGSHGGPLTTLGGLPPSYVREEPGGHVLMEFDRPGCLTRLFMGEANVPQRGEPGGFGRLQLFFDGEATPRFDAPAADLFAGRDARYPPPLVLDAIKSSGGNVSYVPFCFARSLKLRTTSVPADGVGWWQANVLLAPPGTAVRTYDPSASLRTAAEALARAPDAPGRAPAFVAERDVVAGDVVPLAALRGAGTVRRLRFAVAPFDIDTLRSLTLRVRANRAPAPQLVVPLANVFGDGLKVRPLRALAFGMDPAGGTGYFSLPIPFRRGVEISIAAARPARVRMEGWRAPPAPGAGTLYGQRREQRPAEGSDTRVLDAGGSGRLAALVLDDIEGGPVSASSPLQRFLEGDERVLVDGARTPIQYGTGHEESFNGGFYYIFGAFTRELGGAGPLIARPDGMGAQSQYRVYADDGVRWSRSLAYGEEHGGGDEQPQLVAATTFSYRWPTALVRADAVRIGDPASERAHRLRGALRPDELTAYFEGERDGNSTTSTVVAGGTYYPAPAASESPEGVRLRGVRFTGPLALRVGVPRSNAGVVLRGVFDQAPPLVALAVRVNGRAAGTWRSPTGVANPAKRWLESDFEIPTRLTKGVARLDVTLTPLDPGATGSLFGFEALTRTR